jgi:hypothetical protein
MRTPVCAPASLLQEWSSAVQQAVRAVIIAYVDERAAIPNGGHRSSRLASIIQPDRFCTTNVRASALTA